MSHRAPNRKKTRDVHVSDQIVENMQLGVLVYRLENLDDDRTLRICHANPSAVRHLGLRHDELVGSLIDEAFPGIRDTGFPALLAQVVRTGEPAGPTRSEYSDERVELAISSYQAFPLPDQCVGVTFVDITDLVAAERDARRQVRRLAALRSIDLAILSSLDLRLTLQVVLDQATTHLKVDAASILLLGEDGQSLKHVASRGFRESPSASQLGRGVGLPGRVVRLRALLEVPNLAQEPAYSRASAFAKEGFVAYCAAPLISKGKLLGVFELFHRTPLRHSADSREFFESLAGQAAIAIDGAALLERLQRTNAELEEAYEMTLEGWTAALELRDWETQGHTRRVTEMSVELARAVGVQGEDLVHLRRGALLHDIGKIGVPDHILRKPGPLSDDEWRQMRKHPEYAYDLLAPITFLRRALEIPRYHHERWDGSGYPFGLRGTAIPVSARIFSVVDAWDAMRSDRPYRKGLPEEEALVRLRDGAGEQFDPRVVDAFLDARLYELTDSRQLLGIPQ